MSEERKNLASLACIPCRGGIPPMDLPRVSDMMKVVPEWTLINQSVNKIEKKFTFKNFGKAMTFVNRVAEISNEQDHHPDIFIHWNEVTLTLYTHAIRGLHDNDFIMAAKIDEMMG